MLLLEELAADEPLAFVATTVNVYAVPFVNPVTTIGLEDPVAVTFPGDEVTVYPVIDEPPVAFAENAIDACALPPVTEDTLGACGTVVAVTALDAELAAAVP